MRLFVGVPWPVALCLLAVWVPLYLCLLLARVAVWTLIVLVAASVVVARYVRGRWQTR